MDWKSSTKIARKSRNSQILKIVTISKRQLLGRTKPNEYFLWFDLYSISLFALNYASVLLNAIRIVANCEKTENGILFLVSNTHL